MPTITIHNLPAASSVNAADEIPIIQAGTTTVKSTVAQLAAGMSLSFSATDLSIGVGSSAAGYGAAFGAAADGHSYGAAFGYSASGLSYGAAFGYAASGFSSGAAFGCNAAGGINGAAVGANANGSNCGAAVGANASGQNYGAAFGYSATVNGVRRYATTAGSDSASAQLYAQTLRGTTTSTSPKTLTADAAAGGTANQNTLSDNTAQSVRGQLVARTSTGAAAMWDIKALVKRGSGGDTTTVVGQTVTLLWADAALSGATAAVAADTTNGALQITVTPPAATQTGWTCGLYSELTS
jgi:hypothetical protein